MSTTALANVGSEEAWGLDGLGNFATFQEDSDGQGWNLEQERTVNAANEITGIDEGQYQDAWITPEYDAAGNMIVGPRADAPGTAQFYVYDAWNRLAKVFADTDENGEFDEEEDDLVAAYRYDGRNRRIEKILTEAAGQPGSVEYLHNHAWQVLEERVFDDEQELERVYQNVWSPRYIDSMILRDECDPTTGGLLLPARLFYLADANYNVTGLLRADPQTPGEWQVVERYVYDPYGRVTYLDADFNALAPQQSAHDNTTLYTGRTLDRESGLMHYRARYYELLLSTFTTRDPLGYAAGDVNLYRYVGNAPIAFIDPTGLQAPVCIFPFCPAYDPPTGQQTTAREKAKARVQAALETLCKCECLACSESECKAEAERIAEAYVRMYYEKATWRLPRLRGSSITGDYRAGWMCYQWQTHTYNALKPIVEQGKCFDIRRVGLVAGTGGETSLEHNWVAISAIKKVDRVTDRAAAGKCTVYLDPWLGNGPEAYCHTGVGYEKGHPCHNFLGDDPLGDDPSKPGGMGGYYTPPSGPLCWKEYPGWKW